MRKNIALLLLTAVSLILIGCVRKPSSTSFVDNSYDFSRGFDSISIDTGTADLTLLPSRDSKCHVLCHEREDEKHLVSVEDNKLTVQLQKKKSIVNVNMGSENPELTVYLPSKTYRDLEIRSSTGDVVITEGLLAKNVDINLSTGDISLKGISSQSIDLDVSTGRISACDINCENTLKVGSSTGRTDLKDIVCRNLIAKGSTGDIRLDNVIASEKFDIRNSTGSVRFDSCDASEIQVSTSLGSVTGTLLSDKSFVTKTDLGSVSVPQGGTGGRCEIRTDLGNIDISIGR